MIATPQRNISRHCWSSICKLDPAKRSQHLKATDCKNVKRNMLYAFSRHVLKPKTTKRNGRNETTETNKIISK